MPAALSKEVRLTIEQMETNLRIQLLNGSPMENDKATAIELFGRASSLEEAIHYLKLPYTYEVTTTDAKKLNARKQLCGMSIEVLEAMRDELIVAGVQAWTDYVVARNIAKDEA